MLVVGRAAKNPFRFSDQRRLNIPVGLGDWPFYRAKWCAGPSPSLLLDGLDYRDRLKGVQILLSNSQAGPGRKVKQEQEPSIIPLRLGLIRLDLKSWIPFEDLTHMLGQQERGGLDLLLLPYRPAPRT